MKDSQLLYLIGNLWILASLFLVNKLNLVMALFIGFVVVLFSFILSRLERKLKYSLDHLNELKHEMFYEVLWNIESLLRRKR